MTSFAKISLMALVISISIQSAQAASSGTLQLSGTVAAVNDLVVTANASNNTSLNILSGETAKNVASVAETSNNGSGYTISLSSVNGGQLKHATNATKKTNYTVSYGGGSYNQPSTTPTTVKSVSSLGALTTNTSQVLVTVTALAGAPAGTYSDTLTLTIAANP